MPRGKSLNLYLMDGSVNGRVKCTLANWTGIAFKIPRTALDLCRDRKELKQTGVYFLFGKDEEHDKAVVYIGQASVRKNGEGILNRLQEHNSNPEKDYWTEAIAITTSNDSLGPTEISYLEHRFYQLAMEAKRYDVKNGVDPAQGNPSEEKQSELEDFIDYAKIVVGILGHKVFAPLVEPTSADTVGTEGPMLLCVRNGVQATAIRTSDGFVVKKGSILSMKPTKSCPEFVLKKREQYKNAIDENGVLQEDVLFNTPSGASSFVCAASTSGYVEWKTQDGRTLKQLEKADS